MGDPRLLARTITAGAFALLAAAALAAPTAGAQAPERPFPAHTSYVDGSIRPSHLSQAQLDQEVIRLYEQWRDDYLTQNPYEPDQYYVDYSDEFTQPPDAVTTSESTGYGMLATAIMAGADPQAKVYFDGLYRFSRAHPSANDPNLMAWQQADRDGAIITVPGDGESSATDGDLDIAYALLLASEQWGDGGEIDYQAAAESIIAAILASEVQADEPILALGDWAPGDAMYGNGTRSSDWMVQHLKEFEAATGDAGWTAIVDKTYELADVLHSDYSPATGLLPDFAVYADGAPEPAPPSYLESPNDGSYSWNATRAPWRIATDHLITGDARGKAQLDAINAWIRSSTGGDPAEINQGYELDGTPIDPGTDAHTAFSAPFMVSALVDASNQAWVNDLWDYNVSQPSRGYYGDSIRLFSAIVASGNWWSPSASSPEPACTEPETPDPGYEMLFDGTEASFAEWQIAGPGGFNLTAECTLESFGGLGLLHREEVYEAPVTFRIEWMMPGDDNSGVFVGNWDAGPNAHNQSIAEGYEIQIDATDDADSQTGAIYNVQAPDGALRDEALNPPGQWNTYEITVDDPNITVRLNGATINEFTSTDPARDLSASRLGIQNHGTGDEVYFRRIQVKEHSAPPFEPPGCAEPGPVDPDDQFDGTELDGCRWNRVVRPDDAARAVEDGSLHLETSYADIYAANNTPVTNLVLQEAPDGDWVAETKVAVPLEVCCQQAGLVAYLDDGNYVKWDAIADPGMGQARLELRSEIGDAVQDPQENVWVDYPEDDTYWLRLAKQGDTYSAAHSLDGSSWTDFPAAVSNPAISDGAAIGPFVLGIFQDDPIWAAFDWFTLAGEEPVNTPPVIDAIAADPDGGDAPLAVSFTAAASDGDGDELSYEWDFGDGETSDQQSPTHTYTEPGTYEAELTVSDGEANVSDSVSVTVTPGEVGEPAIELEARPPIRRVGAKKKRVSYRARAANVGTGATGALRLCARAPRKRVKVIGASCHQVADLDPDASVQRRFRFKVKRKARGKLTRIRLIGNGPDVDNDQVVVRLRVRR